VAAAPDFTQLLLWNSFDAKTKTSLEAGETYLLPNQYETGVPHEITIDLIKSGRQHQVLDKILNWNGPARLLHGNSDTDVPVDFSIQLFNQLQGRDSQLTIVKDADHRFSATDQLLLIENSVCELINLSKA
jgi:pimeloyl-ACP methyl ester carboxylesterase